MRICCRLFRYFGFVGVRGAGCGVRGAGCGVRGAGCGGGMRGARCEAIINY